jgi:predicted dehydrogenase
MALDLTEEQRAIGRANFERIVGYHGLTRRDFMKGVIAAGAVLPVSAAVYFGYEKLHGKPVKVGLIGAGDEGGVLVGEHNPEYLEFIAYSDIRPYNQKRIFEDQKGTPRKGFERKYGKDARKNIRLYENYKELLANPEIEAVVIALPLHLHAQASIDAMRAGKHVLCEKLMAWNISQCKEMIKVADDTERILAIGHQRHYSMLYAHALEVLNAGELGDIHHIRALWHRNNARPRLDANKNPMTDAKTGAPLYQDGWYPDIRPEDRQALESRVRDFGYKSMEELCRWRLYNRTGGGLMAELGSHQLDACGIFLGKVHPIAVSGVGGKYFYRDDREVDDHVFVTFEYPGKNYAKDKNDIVAVTYSSISTNQFEAYGECVMGSKGTMIVQQEQSVLLYPDDVAPGAGRSMTMTVSTTAPGKPAVDASATSAPVDTAKAQAVGQHALAYDPVSRGYKEEMEDFAYCIRMWNQTGNKAERRRPRCYDRVAMADAIVALTANEAMHRRQRIEFKPEWFDAASKEVPDPDKHADIIA